MIDEILSFDDLRELSGYRSMNRICRWLDDSGIPFLRDRFGRPKVNRFALRKAMGGAAPEKETDLAFSQEPNWDGINTPWGDGKR